MIKIDFVTTLITTIAFISYRELRREMEGEREELEGRRGTGKERRKGRGDGFN